MSMVSGIRKTSCSAWIQRSGILLLVAMVAMTAPSFAAEPPVATQTDECHVITDVPFEDQWASGGHADCDAEAFNHWDEDDPPEVPASCAKCHSTPGYVDFIGADGTEAGQVDSPAPIGTVIDCTACHNEVTAQMDTVSFPSDVTITGLGSEARCMQCHQGRASKLAVDQEIAEADVPDEDTVMPDAGFVNVHYMAAAATQYGGSTLGGYQYDDRSYDIKFAHVGGIETCIDCHNPHSLEVKTELCSVCHEGAVDNEGLRNIRMAGSTRDYDGDGDVTEGVHFEVQGMHAALYEAMQSYAANVGTPIVYDEGSYPYFFNDADGNGQLDPNEATRSNGFAAWTPRLLKAAYNYQFVLKDPGAFAHNAKYAIQLLYDSIADLDAELAAGLTRNDVGHFAGSEEPWRHWDEDGAVPGTCSKCHSAAGLPFYLAEDVTVSQPLSNGLQCATCHDAVPGFTRYAVETVQFPSGARLSSGNPDSNLCINCHQGRESGVSVDQAIADLELDAVSETLGFINPHYHPAGATLFGTLAQGMYEYDGKMYLGRLEHVSSFDSCTECHSPHRLDINLQACANPFCHGGVQTAQQIRKDTRDFDGDGSGTEGLAAEIQSFSDFLLGAMMDYAREVVDQPIVYDGHAYPYFFNDTDANGQVDEGEASFGNRYQSWTPRLLRAAYNYQYTQKDPGAFAHNGKYVIQVLYDSLEDIATQVPVEMSGMVRP